VEPLLRRAIRLVPVVTVAVCASLAIGATGHWLDAHGGELPNIPVPEVSSPPAAVMTPPPGTPPPARENPPSSPIAPPPRRPHAPLAFVLCATNVAHDPERSTATILDGPAMGVYGTGEALPGGGRLARVAAGFIEVDRGDGDRQRLAFPGSSASPGSAAPAPAAGPLDRIERVQIQALLADPSALLREGTRVRPTAEGVRVVGVRPGSLAARFGLENGDLIQAVDGKRLTSPDAALELVGRIRTASSMSVEILRRGQVVTRVVAIL
jgi:general secretion pathway protein C